MNASKIAIFLILVLAMLIHARKLYVDFAGGADASLGTSKGAAWQHHPYMQGWIGSYTHAAGDTFIFKGGVTWPNACFRMNITSGGSSNTVRDYYGVDSSWYTGGSFARPIFDLEATQVATYNVAINFAAGNITMDCIEITGFYWSGAQGWPAAHIIDYESGGSNLTFKNMYIHNWTHGAYPGTSDDLKCFCGKTSAPFNPNSLITHCTFTGPTDAAQSAGYVVYAGCSEFSFNTVTLMPEGPVTSGDGSVETWSVHDNLIYNMNESFDPTLHENAIETLGGGAHVYNNTIYNCQFGTSVTDIVIMTTGAGSAATTDEFYNNVVWGCQTGGIPIMVDAGWSGGHGFLATSKMYIYNNTLVPTGTNVAAIRTIDDGYGNLDSCIARNNHLITDTAFTGKEIVTHYIRDHNLLQTAAVAASNGFSSANNYAPTGVGCLTIDAGVSEASLFSTDILGITRPQGSAWDIGAYSLQYAGTTGDLSAPTINPDGMSIKLTVAGLDSGGTYANGWGLFKVPGANTGYIAVKRLGFNIGAPTTLLDTIFLDTTLRKHYPNDAADSEVVSGGNTTITVALSSVIYLKDTVKYVKVAAGWYTKTGTPNNAYAVTSATNNSTQAYPRVAGAKWHSVDRQRIVGSTFTLSCGSYHISGRNSCPVQAVKFWAFDQHSDTVSSWVTSMNLNTSTGSGIPIQEWTGTLSTTTLTQGDTVQCNFWAFPWYGDSAASLNTGDGVNAYQSGKYTKLVFVNDKNGTYGVTCACVDTLNGVDANGTAVDTATYNPTTTVCYKTVSGAINGIRAYNNTNHGGRQDAGAGHVFMKSDFFFAGGTVTAENPKTWITIEPNIGVAKYGVNLKGQAGSKATNMTHLKNITITSAATSVIDLEKFLFLDGDSINASGLATFYRFTDGFMKDCKVVSINAIPYSTSYGLMDLYSGNTFDLAASITIRPTCVIGNRCITPTHPLLFSTYATGQTIPTQDNAEVAYNILTGNNAAFFTQGYGFPTTGNDSLIHGAAVINNIFEKTAGASPVNQFGADHAINTFNNFLFWYNTSVGQRMNVGYNDHDAVVHNVTNISLKNNAIENRNVVSDNITHDGGPDGTLVGNWQMLWGVNCEGNVFSSFTLAPSFVGIRTMDTSTSTTEGHVSFNWTTDNSQNGAGTGNGNYLPTSSSNVITIAKNQLLPYDIAGTARHANGAAGAYEYGTSAPIITYNQSFILSVQTDSIIHPDTAVNTGGVATSWSSLPTLPAGLDFRSDGVIYGTSTVTVACSTSYTISATNAGGTGTTTVYMCILPSKSVYTSVMITIDELKDSIKSCYPNKVRIDAASTVSQRLITVKIHGSSAPTATTVLWFGGVSLGKNKSYTDTTIVDTLFKYPTMPAGYYRIFAVDPAWSDQSDTLLNGCQLLNPSGTIINPK
jgi:hypothetical protein